MLLCESSAEPVARAIPVGLGHDRREIAVLVREGDGPSLVWLPGFRSNMRSTKAGAIDHFAAAQGRRLVRFDYAGHGGSGGVFAACGISTWLEDTLAVLERFVPDRPILVGSSMGGWIALLAARALARTVRAPAGLVLVAPAADFTERLLWDRLPGDARREITETGIHQRPSAYGDEPYPITRILIEDGRRHLLLDGPIATACHVHIIQGMQDPDVPYAHTLRLMEHMPADDVQLTLVKDGDHRLSRPDDLERLLRAVEGMTDLVRC